MSGSPPCLPSEHNAHADVVRVGKIAPERQHRQRFLSRRFSPVYRSGVIKVAAILVLSVNLAIGLAASARAAACKFDTVKQQIDVVLDKDAAKGAIFRREVADGADSITMMQKLIAPDVAEMADICRFQVGEYLTKRGYPPFH